MKKCTKCLVDQQLSEFSVKDKKTGRQNSWCKTCNRRYQKNHYKANKKTYREKARAWESQNGGSLGKRLRNYSLTEDKYNSMMARHENKCWICLDRPATHIDHDHSCCPKQSSCGECVRGILCARCNNLLGTMRDSLEFIQRITVYLNYREVQNTN